MLSLDPVFLERKKETYPIRNIFQLAVIIFCDFLLVHRVTFAVSAARPTEVNLPTAFPGFACSASRMACCTRAAIVGSPL